MTKRNGILDLIVQTDAALARTPIETAEGEWREFLETVEEEGFRVSRDCGDVTITKADADHRIVLGIRLLGGHNGPMVDRLTRRPVPMVEDDRILTAAIHLGLEA